MLLLISSSEDIAHCIRAVIGRSFFHILWLLGATYLFLEAREVVAREQINNISFFALLFVLSSYQLSVSRNFLTLQHFKAAERCYESSSLMFIASLLAVFDAALDFLIGSIKTDLNMAGPWPFLFGLGWLINLVAVLLAIKSMEIFLPMLFRSHRPNHSRDESQP